MGRLLFSIFLSLFAWGPVAAKSVDPVASFKAFINSAQKVDTEVSVIKHPDKSEWRKIYWNVGNIQYDVKKTDSLINPVIAYVSFTVTALSSRPYSSEAEAGESTDTSGHTLLHQYKVNYQFAEKRWQATAASMEFHIDRVGSRTIELSRTKKPSMKSGEDRLVSRWLPGFYK